MLLDILDNLPRLRMSSNQFKMILWILKECHISNIPSYNGFRKMQERLRNLCGSEPKLYTSSVGNRFYVNDIRETIARDFSNPEVAKHLQFYPEETTGPISEVWQAERWKEFKPSELTPMYANGLRQFYIGEVAVLANGWCVLPTAWIKRKGWVGQWNQHLFAACLTLLQQEYFVRFVSTSPHATSPEQFSALKEQIQATHTNPIPCYNAETHRNCRVILQVPSLPADNPQQSEEASHMGGNANCGCRRCKAGGPHEAGIPRLAAETKQTLEDQINLAMYGVEAPITRLQTATGVKDKVAQYWIDILLKKSREIKANSPGRTAESIKHELEIWLSQQPGDKVNPLLDISGLDPNRDTPVEILHTILLGIIKYVWYMLHSGWTEDQRNLFVIRLQSTDIDGLTIPPIRAAYMMQYRNGLIGKHFKTLMQTMIFHVHDLVSPELFALVKAVSHLGAALWVHEIDDMAQYTVLTRSQSDLSTLIGNVLDAFGDQDPAKILLKIKLHLLPHIVEDARRFGPPIRNSTEVFECFNAIFRLCSILSNHQAPSRDIALKFASMDRMKHILSGGFWKVNNEWVCAGPNVLSVLKNMPIIQRHLGWVPPSTLVPGKIRLVAKSKTAFVRWEDTQAGLSPTDSAVIATVRWSSAVGVTAQSGDFCRRGSWIFAQDSEKAVVVGRIRELLVPESRPDGVPSGIVTLEQFTVSEALHPEFGMPILLKPAEATRQTIASVMFRFSALHDCRLVKCTPTALRTVRQERHDTEQTTNILEHGDDVHFIINMAGLHNATLLRRNLPVALTVPRPLYDDREAHHHQVAIGLRTAQATKRARTQEKRRATLKAKKDAQAGIHTSDEEDSDVEGVDDEVESEEEVRRTKRKRQ
ncbi:hypothetical protein C8R45DRAFT_1054393 [Mycena sanguinolenta]|nr:hypothetical protein C8R45DRAFT_1054393 [Mycena sanguinolenta]